MDFSQVKLPAELLETLSAIYNKSKKLDPGLTESTFIQYILTEWLHPYKREAGGDVQTKQNAILRNNLETAIYHSGKTRIQLAQDIGVHRVYLGQVVNGKCEPSVTIALLLAG